MKAIVYILNAFGMNELGGNGAGVMPHADGLNELKKQTLATSIGLSETAFIQFSKKATRRLSFFTPIEQVPLCGHATIAAWNFLFQQGEIPAGKYTQELQNGIFPIEIYEDGTVIMDQELPVFSEIIPIDQIIEILHIDPETITNTDLSPQIVSTGLRDIFVPVIDRKVLFQLQPDLQKMTRCNKKTNTVGFHVFTLDVINEKTTANSRNFAPLYGIPEESATGSSTGALACYLFKYGKIKSGKIANLKFEQGYSMNKPSIISASLETHGNEITKVQIGGKAILIGQKEVNI